MARKTGHAVVVAVVFALHFALAPAYTLVHNFNYTNWYSSFMFENSFNESLSLGLMKIIGNQVYMSVDNTSIIPLTSTGRKSIWLESKDAFQHGLLIGDFEHMPGSDCGIWPAFWTFHNYDAPGFYGEIDILEGFNDITQN
ncbi:hypothetical protein IFR04_008657 [Cadophora malorum]|uniref:GH16 domain-containing protein n=1 Tax=Cadophora malorum TaxID=108018 RepID=A0A8H7TAX2_9HELO|nr:hypothetical protein IFR04_008657 [Cadophora malorum]